MRAPTAAETYAAELYRACGAQPEEVYVAPAPLFFKNRRSFAHLRATGEQVERIAITRGGKVEVLTQSGETMHVNQTELINLQPEETNGNR